MFFKIFFIKIYTLLHASEPIVKTPLPLSLRYLRNMRSDGINRFYSIIYKHIKGKRSETISRIKFSGNIFKYMYVLSIISRYKPLSKRRTISFKDNLQRHPRVATLSSGFNEWMNTYYVSIFFFLVNSLHNISINVFQTLRWYLWVISTKVASLWEIDRYMIKI